ncbi:MAG: gliding motility-associated ABC transporter ATP-binding subunit GldA [Bacteroidia bacterium]|nr:gliding motility-associated ABC transporter ATP-binding subunit GldA [Bacteroidia bacterium]
MSVSVQDLVKIYGTQKALGGISFEAKPGEILGFLGPNGAGKSTTMKILTGFIPQSSGSAMVCGMEVSQNLKAVRAKIGYLPELNPLYTDMYIREYLLFAAATMGIQGKEGKQRVEEMMEKTGLNKEGHKQISQLSKGYKQRVGLASALLHKPEVLILDEPTSGLDPNQVIEIRQLIREVGKDKTVIFSTHIMQEVEALCSRVVIINKGVLVANDSVDKLKQSLDAVHEIRVEFKSPMPLEKLKSLPHVLEVQVQSPGYTITAKEDIREQLSQLASNENNLVLSMSRTRVSLESVFQNLTK